jgi:hypothetical protein
MSAELQAVLRARSQYALPVHEAVKAAGSSLALDPSAENVPPPEDAASVLAEDAAVGESASLVGGPSVIDDSPPCSLRLKWYPLAPLAFFPPHAPRSFGSQTLPLILAPMQCTSFCSYRRIPTGKLVAEKLRYLP